MFPSLHGVLSQSGAVTWYAGLTDIVAVYQPKGAASLAASYVNLVNPGTYDATVASGTPNWSGGDGWIGNSCALSTGYTPPNNNVTVIMKFANAVAGTRAFIGVISGLEIYIYANLAANQVRYRSNATLSVAPGLSGGVLAIAGKSAYRNGALDGTIGAGSGVGGAALWMMAINNGGSILQPETGNLHAVAICSSIQTADQIAVASAAMALI